MLEVYLDGVPVLLVNHPDYVLVLAGLVAGRSAVDRPLLISDQPVGEPVERICAIGAPAWPAPCSDRALCRSIQLGMRACSLMKTNDSAGWRKRSAATTYPRRKLRKDWPTSSASSESCARTESSCQGARSASLLSSQEQLGSAKAALRKQLCTTFTLRASADRPRPFSRGGAACAAGYPGRRARCGRGLAGVPTSGASARPRRPPASGRTVGYRSHSTSARHAARARHPPAPIHSPCSSCALCSWRRLPEEEGIALLSKADGQNPPGQTAPLQVRGRHALLSSPRPRPARGLGNGSRTGEHPAHRDGHGTPCGDMGSAPPSRVHVAAQ